MVGMYYILEGRTPVQVDDVNVWSLWFRTAERAVRCDKATVTLHGQNVGEITISTIFLGLNHRFVMDEEPPLLFETMGFGGPLDGEYDRSSTCEAAEMMHEAMCERVKQIKSQLQ